MHMDNANIAIVFSPGSSGLGIIQILHANGVPCIAMDCKRLWGTRRIGTYSRYADYVQCPDPLDSERLFIEFVYDFCRKQTAKPVLFPTLDHWAVCLARHKDLLQEVSLPCAGNPEAVELFVDKERFYERYAPAAGPQSRQSVRVPATWSWEDISSLKDIPFPIAAKPKSKLSLSDPESGGLLRNISIPGEKLRLNVLENHSSLKDFLIANRQYSQGLLFQEYIPGMADSMYSVGIYANSRAEILGVFTGKKIRGYPALYGDCTVGINHAVPESALDMVKTIVSETGYSGIAEFEFKENADTGEFVLIEVNPRPWSWIGITGACPDNLPLIAYRDLCGGPVPTQEKKQANGQVLYVKVLQDCLNCLLLYARDYPPWRKSPGQWLKSIKAEKVVYCEFNEADWPVAGMQLVHVLIIDPLKALVKSILKVFSKG
jgi:D-aspartate ligase